MFQLALGRREKYITTIWSYTKFIIKLLLLLLLSRFSRVRLYATP